MSNCEFQTPAPRQIAGLVHAEATMRRFFIGECRPMLEATAQTHSLPTGGTLSLGGPREHVLCLRSQLHHEIGTFTTLVELCANEVGRLCGSPGTLEMRHVQYHKYRSVFLVQKLLDEEGARGALVFDSVINSGQLSRPSTELDLHLASLEKHSNHVVSLVSMGYLAILFYKQRDGLKLQLPEETSPFGRNTSIAKCIINLTKSDLQSFISRTNLTSTQALFLNTLCSDCASGRLAIRRNVERSLQGHEPLLSMATLLHGASHQTCHAPEQCVQLDAIGGRLSEPMWLEVQGKAGKHARTAIKSSVRLVSAAHSSFAVVEFRYFSDCIQNRCAMRLDKLSVLEINGRFSITKYFSSIEVPCGGYIMMRIPLPMKIDESEISHIKATWVCHTL